MQPAASSAPPALVTTTLAAVDRCGNAARPIAR